MNSGSVELKDENNHCVCLLLLTNLSWGIVWGLFYFKNPDNYRNNNVHCYATGGSNTPVPATFSDSPIVDVTRQFETLFALKFFFYFIVVIWLNGFEVLQQSADFNFFAPY